MANLGTNTELNGLLASATGYTGDFGNGQYQNWVNTQDDTTKKLSTGLIGAYNAGTSTATSTAPTFAPVATIPVQPAAATVRDVTPEETVSGQLNTLLAEDSPYIQSARNKALETGNARGLLNSSMVAGSGERAAIDAAAPIAAQDASTYAASGLSAQNANQDLTATGYKSALDLSGNSILSAQNAAQTAKSNAYQTNQEYENNKALQTQSQAATASLQTSLKQMDVNLDLTQLAQSDRTAFASAVAPVMQQFQSEISQIERTPDVEMDAAAKAAAIQEQRNYLKSNLAPIAQIYGYTMTWDDVPADTPAPATPSPTPTTPTTPADPWVWTPAMI